MYGQGKTRGQVGLLKIKAATNQACAAIRCKGSLDPIFVIGIFRCVMKQIVNWEMEQIKKT